jgi:hypothetical protein
MSAIEVSSRGGSFARGFLGTLRKQGAEQAAGDHSKGEQGEQAHADAKPRAQAPTHVAKVSESAPRERADHPHLTPYPASSQATSRPQPRPGK